MWGVIFKNDPQWGVTLIDPPRPYYLDMHRSRSDGRKLSTSRTLAARRGEPSRNLLAGLDHGVSRNFSKGGKSTFAYLFLVVGDATQIDVHTKENVQCYDNSCIQCFPCKKTKIWKVPEVVFIPVLHRTFSTASDDLLRPR